MYTPVFQLYEFNGREFLRLSMNARMTVWQVGAAYPDPLPRIWNAHRVDNPTAKIVRDAVIKTLAVLALGLRPPPTSVNFC